MQSLRSRPASSESFASFRHPPRALARRTWEMLLSSMDQRLPLLMLAVAVVEGKSERALLNSCRSDDEGCPGESGCGALS